VAAVSSKKQQQENMATNKKRSSKKRRGSKKKLKPQHSPKPKKVRRAKKPIVTDEVSPIPFPDTQSPK